MSGRLRFYTFEVVSKRNIFPFEMLTYDHAWPRDENANLHSSYGSGEHRIRMVGIKPPARGRWESFGWKVENVERPYMSYPTKADLAIQKAELEERLAALIAGVQAFYDDYKSELSPSWEKFLKDLLNT